jgi:hypothetical protein
MRKSINAGSAACLVAACGAASAQTVMYVDDDAPAGGNGSSWATAFSDLNDALIRAATLPPPVTIRVAGGTYRPRVPLSGPYYQATFRMVDGLSVVGAYRGLAPGGNPDDRSTILFPTTLSGQLSAGTVATVISAASGAPSFALDGLIVDHSMTCFDCGTGNGPGAVSAPASTVVMANCTFDHHISRVNIAAIQVGTLSMTDCTVLHSTADTEDHPCVVFADSLDMTRCRIATNYGGVACTSGRFTNCTFEDNAGGMANGGGGGVRAAGDVLLVGCIFRRNGSNSATGGAVIAGGSATAINCVFAANRGHNGSAMYGRVAAYNCSFLDNVTTGDGGAVFAAPGSVLVNCTLARNTGQRWGGGLWINGNTTVSNSILWANTGSPTTEGAQVYVGAGTADLRYNLVQAWSGTLGGVANSGLDPHFANLASGDLSLAAGSPAIDSADSTALPPDTFDLDKDGNTTEPLPLDLAMRPRLVDDSTTANSGAGKPAYLDRGAFEYQTPGCYANCDGSTTLPLLTVNDFVCFQSRFAAGDPWANCDGSTTPPILNVADMVCFQSRFAAGCP